MVVALAVAVALVALVAWWTPSRRREGWAFTGKVKDFSGEKGVKHANFIRKKCSGGMTWTAITSNDKWKWMAQYDGDAAWKICEEAQKSAVSDDKMNQSRTVKCKYRCPYSIMRGERPCANNDYTKCCKPGEGTKLYDCELTSDAKVRSQERARETLRGVVEGLKKPTNGGGGGGGGGVDRMQQFQERQKQESGRNKPAPTEDPINDLKVTVWSDKDLNGDSKDFGIGSYPNLGDWNDRISSIYVPPGLTVKGWQHTNYNGNSVFVDPSTRTDLEGSWMNMKDFTENGVFKKGSNKHDCGFRNSSCFNDTISSMKVERK